MESFSRIKFLIYKTFTSQVIGNRSNIFKPKNRKYGKTVNIKQTFQTPCCCLDLRLEKFRRQSRPKFYPMTERHSSLRQNKVSFWLPIVQISRAMYFDVRQCSIDLRLLYDFGNPRYNFQQQSYVKPQKSYELSRLSKSTPTIFLWQLCEPPTISVWESPSYYSLAMLESNTDTSQKIYHIFWQKSQRGSTKMYHS